MISRSGPRRASPDEYVQSLSGWQRDRVEMLREIALRVGESEETVKWGHLVYVANGPCFLIRADQERVQLGFWRGKRLLDIEPRMTGGGKYEMRSLDLNEATEIEPATAERLMRDAIKLNYTIGNPQVVK